MAKTLDRIVVIDKQESAASKEHRFVKEESVSKRNYQHQEGRKTNLPKNVKHEKSSYGHDWYPQEFYSLDGRVSYL